MPRYLLITPTFGTFPNAPSGHKLGTGTFIADTIGNALPGDVVWGAFVAAPSPLNLRPADAAAAAIMNLPITTPAQLVTGNLCGGSGAGLDAGN